MMPATEAHWDKDFDFLSNQLASLVAKQRLGLGIDLDNGSVVLHGYDRVRNCFQELT